jgi:hypothetical protein
MRLLTNGRRRAIQLDDGTLLAVPPFNAKLAPRAVRVKIYEYVIRRQPGMAQIVAEIASDARTGGDERDRLASMISEDPYQASLMVQEAA